jgi:hypothetical protein
METELDAILKTMKNEYLKTHFNLQINDAKWSSIRDNHLQYALQYRWEHDPRFTSTVNAVRMANKYLLYSNKVRTAVNDLGGVRNIKTQEIVGENRVGRMIMEMAGF